MSTPLAEIIHEMCEILLMIFVVLFFLVYKQRLKLVFVLLI